MTVSDTASVLQVVFAPVLYAYQMFDNFLQSTNLTGVWSAFFMVMIVTRFILMPLVGSLRAGSGSDTASHGSKGSGNDSEGG